MSQNPIRVLCLFDYAATTGFSTVSQNIVSNLKKHYRDRLKLHICAINYFGDPFYQDDNTYVFGASRVDPKGDEMGRNEFWNCARKNDYELIFIIQDIGVLNQMAELWSWLKRDRTEEKRKNPKVIVYFPVDSPPLHGFLNHMDIYDRLVTYTEYGRQEILKKKPAWKTKIRVIPHGNNQQAFYPVDEREKELFRDDYFGPNSEKYIVTCVNRNQHRKDIPNTVSSFLEYKQQFDPDAFLYLHMSHDDHLGWNLKVLLEQTGLVENIDFQLLDDAIRNHGASTGMLNLIYNASDVFITTTLGEGWGLTITEAMACKLPVVAPLHTSIKEIADNGARLWGCEEFRPAAPMWDSIYRDQVDYREVAEKINDCKTNKEETLKKVEAAYKYINKLSWEYVCDMWISEFKTLVN